MHVNCPYICTHIYTQCCFSVRASCLHIFAQSDKNQRKITAENLRQHLPSSVGESEKTLFLRLVSSDALMHCFIYHIYTYTSDILISANHVKNMSLFATKKWLNMKRSMCLFCLSQICGVSASWYQGDAAMPEATIQHKYTLFQCFPSF